jgi:hypothetical protein
MAKTASAVKAQGVDLAPFLDESKSGLLYSKPGRAETPGSLLDTVVSYRSEVFG